VSPIVRTPRDLTPTAWARARAAVGNIPYDLTVSNPTLCDIAYPPGLLDPLRDPAALSYRPEPKGLRSAREVVAAEYAAGGAPVDPDRIVLTASSSESYAFLFKLLCDPGDAVLVPAPSYALFEHLAALEGVRVVPFPLDPAGDWRPQAPEAASLARARAAILVHPNNPTGSWVDPVAAEAIAGCAPGAPLPLIVDEVFLDYAWAPHEHARTFAARSAGMTFTLGGLSKSRGLPQLKLSWIVVSGPDAGVGEALARLEFIADSYLSVATPVQLALPELLRGSIPVRDAILARCIANHATAAALVGGAPAVALVPAHAGWSAVLRFPRVVPEERLVLELLERHGVAVHPGYFFDFPVEGYLVVSLLAEPERFAAGLKLVLAAIG